MIRFDNRYVLFLSFAYVEPFLYDVNLQNSLSEWGPYGRYAMCDGKICQVEVLVSVL